MANQKAENLIMTQLTLANAAQLVNDTIVEIAGDEISTHLAGERMHGNVLHETIMTKFRSSLARHLSR